MLSSKTLYLLALAFLCSCINGASIEQKRDNPGFVKTDFNVELRTNSTSNQKRGDLGPFNLKGTGYYYYIDVYAGSNKQKNSVLLDTGSSDLWLSDKSLPADEINGHGGYDPKSSSTYKLLNHDFSDRYGDGSYGMDGDWVTDDISLSPSGPSVNLQFGDATYDKGHINIGGILGLGDRDTEQEGQNYPNYPEALKNKGLIAKSAYSLYLGSQDAQSGSIIFGGIDHAKYSGNLAEFPNTAQPYLGIQLDSVSVGGNQHSINAPVALDSGTPSAQLPTSLVYPIFSSLFPTEFFPQTDDGGRFYAYGSCPDAGDLTFNFNGVSINVPKSDYLIEDDSGAGTCTLNIPSYTGRGVSILGDIFLRHAYVVFDLQDQKISIAPVKYTSDSNISVIS